jgi:hypothetical protein
MMRRAVWTAAAIAAGGVALGAYHWQAAAQDDASRSLGLSFTSYLAAPAVLQQFAIEQALAPVDPILVAGEADVSLPRIGMMAAISPPVDEGGDGKWRVSAEWVELTTDKAWMAVAEVPVDALDVSYDTYGLQVIFGPNGEMLIGSDKPGNALSDKVDIVRVCGVRVPAADRAWQRETGYFPEIPDVLADMADAQATAPHCAGEG